MLKTSLPRLLFLLLALGSSSAFAWGAKGHRVIAALAETQLTPAAQAAVRTILQDESLIDASIWADTMRGSRDDQEFWSRHAATWHYVNLEPGQAYTDSAPNPMGDAIAALETFAAILLDEPPPEGPVHTALLAHLGPEAAESPELKRFALRFLLHIIGDLQQPLHSGYAGDRGGNTIAVSWFGKPGNLHSLWDTLLLEHQYPDEAVLVSRLQNRLRSTPAIDLRYMERATPAEWLEECQRLLARIHARRSDTNDYAEAYAAEFVPSVEQQLLKGGLRTAWVLNSIFGGWPVGSP